MALRCHVNRCVRLQSGDGATVTGEGGSERLSRTSATSLLNLTHATCGEQTKAVTDDMGKTYLTSITP